ncbi:hypothetical protein EIP91_000557 [Steccherinum ochraceum]|uniref:Vacuolar protein sorting-associated protein vta1 n=1 Tax=Steccherinum ochraceum TaxID=92696 RepID=A0A4R0RW74_9APHY|nr:hypothetical protein EIP91_000557 [Steccherinum ochraceum]
MVTLNLTPAPSELKNIAPYLQRANELKVQEPVMSYWCAYYAAQLGIALKSKDAVVRNFLFELLGALETVKKEIGPNDAIDDENASAAFVESFALKVFNMADAEDRKGQATRGTAKKFLAAAHFLEILATFDSAGASDGVSESTVAEKIRYSKWKAADIAKAFREGRKPTPGPADGPQDEDVAAGDGEIHAPTINIAPAPDSPPQIVVGSPPTQGIARAMSPPHLDLQFAPFPLPSPSQAVPPPVNSAYINPDSLDVAGSNTPSSWSTVATPGSPAVSRHDVDDQAHTPTPVSTRRAWMSTDVEGRNDDSDLEEDTSAHQPGLSAVSTTGEPSTTPALSATSQDFDILTPPAIPRAPPNSALNSGFIPSAPTVPPPIVEVTTPTQSSQTPARSLMSALVPPTPEPSPAVAVPLTPGRISKVQKHCKYAISALDYEDAETAKAELRKALAELGGL